MAHPKSKRMALRSAYCYKALSLEEAAALVGISIGTARRWKTDAQKAEDDDWDKVKAASSLAGEGMEAVARQIRKLVDFTSQRFPQHAPALLEVLEPFGALIAKELG